MSLAPVVQYSDYEIQFPQFQVTVYASNYIELKYSVLQEGGWGKVTTTLHLLDYRLTMKFFIYRCTLLNDCRMAVKLQ